MSNLAAKVQANEFIDLLVTGYDRLLESTSEFMPGGMYIDSRNNGSSNVVELCKAIVIMPNGIICPILNKPEMLLYRLAKRKFFISNAIQPFRMHICKHEDPITSIIINGMDSLESICADINQIAMNGDHDAKMHQGIIAYYEFATGNLVKTDYLNFLLEYKPE